MIPTIEQYQAAKQVILAYESEQNRLFSLRVEAFRKDLADYFKNNLIDGDFELKEFTLDWTFHSNYIIPKNPTMDEDYCGGNDEDIKALCEKHGVKFKMASWCYHK